MNNYKVNISEGNSGEYEIKKFVVSEDDAKFGMLRSLGRGGRYTPAGTYTALTRNGKVIMSDTPNEISDHYEIIRKAKGRVLINGLGLGMVLKAVLNKPEVTEVIVIEKSPDVISLVAPNFKDNSRCHILWADAFEYKPKKNERFDAVWHDIWDDICLDNLSQMMKLHRRYGRFTAWQGSWCKERLEYLKRHNKWR